MLRRMSPEHRFGTAARLSAEVLGGVADEALALDACGEVLGDALRILTSEHIKVRFLWFACRYLCLWSRAGPGRLGGALGNALRVLMSQCTSRCSFKDVGRGFCGLD